VSGAVLVIAIIGAFFIIGIAVGALAVISAFSLRSDTARAARKRARTGSGWTDTTTTGWEEPPGPVAGGEHHPASGPPHWPGGPSGR
jgi:hypothetical protein